jgi:peptidoglycan/xylan/chitin deacetylase (PgdA/CDA1 family)
MTIDELRAEMAFTDQAVASIISKLPRFLRPPFLEFRPESLSMLETMGYVVINISVDSKDWRFVGNSIQSTPQNVAKAFKEAFEAVKNKGSFISLQHDTIVFVRHPFFIDLPKDCPVLVGFPGLTQGGCTLRSP